MGYSTTTDAIMFIKGSVTCHGNAVKGANCPKDQYMVVKTASYRGLSDTKACGLSNDYVCEVNVTCLFKKQCDGQHECSMTVDNNLFSGDQCPGLTKYPYFEYQCINTSQTFDSVCGTYSSANSITVSLTVTFNFAQCNLLSHAYFSGHLT